jgi:hypothetical protein
MVWPHQLDFAAAFSRVALNLLLCSEKCILVLNMLIGLVMLKP